jgi:hypothetical protein
MRRRLSVFFAMAVFVFGVSSRSAHADPVKCHAAIGKSAAAFAQAKIKILQKCAEGRFKGKITTTCQADQKTQNAITKAQTKAVSGIAKACGGKDKTCDTIGDDSLASIGWDSTTCPDFEARGCTNAINNCSDIGTCLTCIGEKAVDRAIDLYYQALTPPNPNPQDPKLEKARNKCQLAIGKSAAAFFLAKSKAIQKCWDTVNKGKATGPCPPFGADQKTDDAIQKAKDKYDAATCKACGTGKPCDITQSPFTKADIGFAPLCPPVVIPGIGGHTCDFARTLVSLEDVRDCVECVTEFKVDCATVAAARGFPQVPSYPAGCAAALPVTPTPTSTPTATQTISVPTTTATPPPGCPTKITFTGTSTNGVLDTGWTGAGHDATVISDGTVTVAVTSCTGSSPNCAVCSYVGPIDNAPGQIRNRRCSGDSSVPCPNGNADCTGLGTCKVFFGTYLPLAAGGVSTCVENTFNAGITGTANVDTGDSVGAASLTSRVFTGVTLANPCPQCLGDGPANDGTKGGTCSSGPRQGQSCDASGSSPNLFFGTTSLDCPPDGGAVIAALPIDLSNTTGTKARTLSAGSPTCRAPGFGGNKCQCDTCNDAAGEPCASNADCPVSGRCAGGSNAGKPCTTGSQCPGGACSGRPCTLNTQCDSGSCSGGVCTTAAGICGGTSGQRCTGGANAGAPCSSTCAGGANVGAICASTSECPSSACTGAAQCPGGACNVTGQATKPNDCSDATCSPTDTCVGGANDGANCSASSECPGGSCAAGNEGTCAGGPFDQFCSPHATFRGCATDAQCATDNACVGGGNAGAKCSVASECPSGSCQSKLGGTPETCAIGKFRDCFDSGNIGESVVASGHVDVPVNHQSDPTLAALFCIGPTTSGSVNAAAGIPGLGRLELKGHAADNGTP